ncbi:TonB-dependent receptor [Novosphingobium sp. MD-1]|uniref:TonB-dependent receptor n=1 Tax=Novosphingobium sp. MD-1 TaxID=1630648 RepID=UPI00061BA3EC|nr:TonB-dependent receptor [Novosphingobium sp. MD-1]GAO56470.1 trehalose-regulated tonB-dependent outer membrane receptor [Novosphingobium sp. MD-1]
MRLSMNGMVRSGVAAGAIALALAANAVQAQDAAAPQDVAASETVDDANAIVVIGTPGGAGVRKQDASYAITTINEAALERISPKSTAEVFTLVPGVWAESSSGVAGANIDVRGLPGGSDAPWVTMSLNGAPIYGTESLSFMDNSSIFRTDETIASTEAAHGGPNAVFSNGEVGVTLNFNLKKGGETTEGRVKLSATDYGSARADAVISGPLGHDLYYMIGGYVQQSPGIRDAQFKSEKGRQISAQLTKKFDNGEISIWTRVTDDHGQWYLPMALNTGNDLGTFSQLGNATRYATLQVGPNETKTYDFARGRGWKGSLSGLNLKFDLGGGWSVRDNLSYTNGNADTLGFVPDGSPIRVSALQAANPGLGTIKTAGGVTLNANDWIQNYGHWVVEKKIESFTNDLSVNFHSGINNFTAGYYRADWSADDFWTLGNAVPVQNVQNGDLLQSGITCGMLASAGSGSSCFHYGIRSSGDAQVNAIYLADSVQVTDKLRIDLGVRHQWLALDYVIDSNDSGTYGYPDGTVNQRNHVTAKKFAYSAAANYAFDPHLGVFLRYSKGYRYPNFDDLRNGNPNVFGVSQLEGGVKYSSQLLSLYATVFYNKNNNFDSTVGSVVANSQFKTRAYGLELDGNLRLGAFGFATLATLQNAKVTASSTPGQVGNEVLRQPKYQVRLSPSYDVTVGAVKVSLFGAASFIGARWSDLANSSRLPAYTKLDLGAQAKLDSGLFFSVRADNLNNSHGLTEGDPRNPATPNGRPILGRSVLFSLGYDF